jgi:hypothetical protein
MGIQVIRAKGFQNVETERANGTETKERQAGPKAQGPDSYPLFRLSGSTDKHVTPL